MRRFIIALFTLLFVAFLAPLSWAGDIAFTHALAMHGAPTLPATATHYPYANPDAPVGGTLRQSAAGTFDTLNPFTLKGKAPQGLNLVYDRLMDRSQDEPFTLYPLIAQGVSIPPDRSSITFALDPRARFSDDTPITSADVAFTFTILRDHGRPNMRRVYKLVDNVVVIDPHTIRFDLNPHHDRETVMILAMMPILSKTYWEKRNFEGSTLSPGVTTGPYRITAVDPGRRLVFTRNPNYWAKDIMSRRGLNNFTTIVYDYFRDETVAFQAFKSGDLNFRRENDLNLWNVGYDFAGIKSGAVQRERLPHGRAEIVRALIPNARRAPFDDIRVRQALFLAFDFDWVNRALFHNALTRTTSIFPNTDLAAAAPSPPGHPSPLARRAHLRQADTLLTQAGWIVKDGARVNAKTGKPLTFEILLGAPEEEKIILSYARDLRRLGILARLRTLDLAAFRDRINGYDYDMLSYNWFSTLSPGAEQWQYWSCAAARENNRFNYAGVCDPAIDTLTEQLTQATTRDDLRTAARALDQKITDGYYLIPFGHHPADLVAYDRHIHHPATSPLYGIIPETWWWQDNLPTPAAPQNTPEKGH